MKLSNQDVAALATILSTCAVAGIESIIIEDGVVRGASEARTAAIISDVDVPRLPQAMGLSRLGALKQRMDLLSSGGASIEVHESAHGQISALEIVSGRSRARFRCTSTQLIKAPRTINGQATARVFLTRTESKMVLDAVRVMGAKRAALCLRNDGQVAFEMVDSTNDIFKVDLENPIEELSGERAASVNYYPADVFASVLRAAQSESDFTVLEISDIGCVILQVSGHSITLLPQINEETDE